MKVQLIERGGKYFIRHMLFGFFPVYYNDTYDGGWEFFAYDMSKSDAEIFLNRWERNAAERKAFKASKTKVIKEIDT